MIIDPIYSDENNLYYKVIHLDLSTFHLLNKIEKKYLEGLINNLDFKMNIFL